MHRGAARPAAFPGARLILLAGGLLAMLLPSGPAAAEEALRDPAALRAPAPGCLAPPHLLGAAVPGNLRRTTGPASAPGPAARRPAVPPQPPVMWEPPPLRLAIHSCLLTEAPAPRGQQPRRT